MQLFHYTDINAVRSILEGGKLRLTDFRYLNDSQEVHEGVSSILDCTKRELRLHTDNCKYFLEAAEFVLHMLEQGRGNGQYVEPIFVCSFSRAADLLSQWRTYGSYAIEFSATAFPHELYECVYDKQEQLSIAEASVKSILRGMAAYMEEAECGVERGVYYHFCDLMLLAAKIKHSSFSEEQEVRLVVGHDIDPSIGGGPEVMYRSRDNMLVPFIEVSIPFDSIRAIHVGPMRDQELACGSLKEFVKRAAWDYANKKECAYHEVEIVKSSTPYRAL